jgi:phosphonoacetaldehyde hydrolase
MYSRIYSGKVKMVVLDTAGTVCDGNRDLRHRWPEDDQRGCKAPVLPFYKVFLDHGIVLDWSVIRGPMGMYKPDHLRYLLELPEVSKQYRELFGHDYTEDEYLKWLEEFKTLLASYALDDDLIQPIEGAKECIQELRQAEIIIGCDTGYFDNISKLLNKKLAEEYEITFDVASNAEITSGRPSPAMIYDCMMKAKISPSQAVVKVDDTVAGILSGNSAGCWTVGLYTSGSDTYEKLAAGKPDYLIPSIKYLPEIIFTKIEPRLRRGEIPGQGL